MSQSVMINGGEGRDARRSPKLRVRGVLGHAGQHKKGMVVVQWEKEDERRDTGWGVRVS